MMQKFQKNEFEHTIVLADEARHIQYGTLGVAINMGLPNAPKIAFTSTSHQVPQNQQRIRNLH